MKIIYIEIDDELSNLLDKIKNTKEDEIYIVIPKRSAIVFSIINFKIIKRLADSLGKKIFIVSVDKKTKFLSSLVGISVIDKINENKNTIIDDTKNPELQIIKEIKKEKKKKENEEISIKEFVKTDNFIDKIKSSIYNEYTIRPQKKYYLFIFLFVSIFLFLLVIYIALPSTTLYITPKSEVTEFSTNIIFSDESIILNDEGEITANTIPYKTETIIVDKTSVYPSTGEIYEGNRARGKLTLYNNSNTPKEFVRSRFMTEDGLIFWSLHSIKVPAKKADGSPGSITFEVEADIKDINGNIIGERGNIPANKKFTMPAIPNLSPSVFYAVNNEPFYGGTTIIIKYVSEDDIKLAKEKIKNELVEKAVKELQQYLQNQNKEFKTNRTLLIEPKTYTYKLEKIEIPNDIIGKKVNDFTVYGQIKFSGISYDKSKLTEILVDGVKKRINPDMILDKIDQDQITLYPIDVNLEKKYVKMEATIRAKSMFDFTQTTITGIRMRQKIRNLIAGKPYNEAMKLLKNIEEIDDVQISNWPFWRTNIASMDSQINIELK